MKSNSHLFPLGLADAARAHLHSHTQRTRASLFAQRETVPDGGLESKQRAVLYTQISILVMGYIPASPHSQYCFFAAPFSCMKEQNTEHSPQLIDHHMQPCWSAERQLPLGTNIEWKQSALHSWISGKSPNASNSRPKMLVENRSYVGRWRCKITFFHRNIF